MLTLSEMINRIKNNQDSAELTLEQCQTLLKACILELFAKRYKAKLDQKLCLTTSIEVDLSLVIRPSGKFFEIDLKRMTSA
ncbi:MAG: hypothetical protein ACK4PR_14315, partial [Gammaproteobacteria bacterium]